MKEFAVNISLGSSLNFIFQMILVVLFYIMVMKSIKVIESSP